MQTTSVIDYPILYLAEEFSTEEGCDLEAAKEIELEIKKYLFLTQHSEFPLPMGGVLDRYWHKFILDTKQYSEFCESALGSFVHHVPARGDKFTKENHRNLKQLYTKYFGEMNPNYWSYTISCGDEGECGSCGAIVDCSSCGNCGP